MLPTEREELARGGPCVFIASSGMLTGGPSCFYAQALAPDPKSAIFITGYQDEESPGRRLLDLAEGTDRLLRLQGQAVSVACRVSKYNLSAHADAAQMLGVLDRLQPQDVYLVQSILPEGRLPFRWYNGPRKLDQGLSYKKVKQDEERASNGEKEKKLHPGLQSQSGFGGAQRSADSERNCWRSWGPPRPVGAFDRLAGAWFQASFGRRRPGRVSQAF